MKRASQLGAARVGIAVAAPFLALGIATATGLTLRAASGGQAAPEWTREQLLAIYARGYSPGRSGDVSVVPEPGVTLTGRGPTNRFMHGTPWTYDQRIPLVFYGPDRVRPGPRADSATLQDVGATLTRWLGLQVRPEQTGRVLRTVFDAETGEPGPPPAILAVLVLDALRADYLTRFEDRMPELSRLRHAGAWFPNARIDYAPTNTSVAHTTIVTGTDPSVHRMVGNTFYDRELGAPTLAYADAAPDRLGMLTWVDRWAHVTAGASVIAAQGGTDYPAVALAGHGACRLNGVRVAMAYYVSSTGLWQTNDRCYRLAASYAGVQMDISGMSLSGEDSRPYRAARYTSRFSRFEGESLVRLIESEPFGRDTVADLVLANLKATDYVSHQYGPFSRQMRAALSELDRQVGRIVRALAGAAGTRGFVLVITADHGMAPDRGSGNRVFYDDIARTLDQRVDPGGPGVVAFFSGSENQLYLDRVRLAQLGLTVAEIATELETLPEVHAALPEAEIRRVACGSPECR